MPRPRLAAPIFLSLIFLSFPASAAEPANYFRADGGVAAGDHTLPDQLDAPGVLKWRVPLTAGHSTPCVAGDAIYLTTYDKEHEKLATVALDRATGSLRWSRPAPAERLELFHPTGSPAASSCACDGQRVFAFFGSFGLLCYDLEGKLLWQKPLGPFQDEFGAASSPVLAEGRLLLNEDHDKDSFLLCVDASSGNTLWEAPRDAFTRSYSTPVIFRRGNGKQVIVAGALELVSYDLETGKQLWSIDGLARIVNPTPAVGRELIYVAGWTPGGDTDARIAMEPWPDAVRIWDKNGDKKISRQETDNKDVLDRFYRIDLDQDQGLNEEEWNKYARVFERARNTLLAVRPGDGHQPPQVAWEYDKGLPYVASPLLYQDVLYLVRDGGIVTSLDAATGKVHKTARARGAGTYYSSPVAGDGKVYLANDHGVITVLKAGPQWEILSSHHLDERTVATPVIAEGRIYVRTDAALYCFGNR
jgi:outer membrane protein assembly factor BamB